MRRVRKSHHIRRWAKYHPDAGVRQIALELLSPYKPKNHEVFVYAILHDKENGETALNQLLFDQSSVSLPLWKSLSDNINEDGSTVGYEGRSGGAALAKKVADEQVSRIEQMQEKKITPETKYFEQLL